MPFALQTATGNHLPKWCDDSRAGQAFWAVLFSVSFVRYLHLDLLCIPSFNSSRFIHSKIYFSVLCDDEFLHSSGNSFRMFIKPWNISVNKRRILSSSSLKKTFKHSHLQLSTPDHFLVHVPNQHPSNL